MQEIDGGPPGCRAVSEPCITVAADGLQFPEAPRWSGRDGCLYLVDWTADRVLKLAEGTLHTCFETPGGGPSGLCQDSRGTLWVCLYTGRRLAAFSPHGTPLGEWDACHGQAFRGPCDLVCDARDGVYFSDAGDFEDDWRSGRAAGALHYLPPERDRVLRLDDGLHYPNGLALSTDGRWLFVNEHRRNRTLRYRVAPDGSLTGRQVWFAHDHDCLLPEPEAFQLGPDGLCADQHDRLFVAHYGGGKVVVLDPGGDLVQVVRLPEGRRPTSVACVPDGSCYVTEADRGLLYHVRFQGRPPPPGRGIP